MDSENIFKYIQKLENLNDEYRKKNEQLEKMYSESEIDRVNILEKLNSKSLFETTARTKTHDLNFKIAKHLRELGDMTSDFYKAATYNVAADAIAMLDFEVQDGESLMNISGIGKGIASKVDQFLNELNDNESICSSTYAQYVEDSELEPDSDSDSEFFISFNSELADVLDDLAHYEKDTHKSRVYDKAASIIDQLPYKVTNGEELAIGPKKIPGIGKGIAKIIDEYIETGKVKKLEELENNISTEDEDVTTCIVSTYNSDLADIFEELSYYEKNRDKKAQYDRVADIINHLSFEVTSGKELLEGDKKVDGINKSIAKIIDEFLETGKVMELETGVSTKSMLLV
jgi:DNA polymerase/3'-5' exonuclease PolX